MSAHDPHAYRLTRWVSIRSVDDLHMVYWYNEDGTISGVIDDAQADRWGTTILNHVPIGDTGQWIGGGKGFWWPPDLYKLLVTHTAQKHPDVQAMRASPLVVWVGAELRRAIDNMRACDDAARKLRSVERTVGAPATSIAHRAAEEADDRAAMYAMEAVCRYALHGPTDPMEPA